ncbi:YihY/virulence factor BrkB family protein [Rudanella lutea]|uniref:YihY/virulence factor BrkB family protein n=1 Tax=Rudanella lutea TaxID=451374 RepID=UPI00037CADFA|nr:YihY/virulence factor BrkB family protein [Rudanella lutea]
MFDKLMGLSALSGARDWLRTHRPFDSKVITWYDFINKIIDKIAGNDLSERAAAVAFNLFLAIFPAIIFLFTLIPYIPIPDLQPQIMNLLSRVIPAGTFEAVDTTIRDIIGRQRSGVLSFGFLATVYAATNGMVALMNAFHTSQETPDRRSFLKIRLTALALTFSLGVAIVVAIIVLLVGGIITEYLLQFGFFSNPVIAYLLSFVRYLLVFAVFVGVVSVIYKFGPDVDMKWTFITPGSLTASILIVLTTLLFSFYLSNFGSYNKIYGSIGTLIALMVWINLIALLVVLGFEMNVSLYGLEGEKKPKPEEKVADTKTTNTTLNK